MVCNISSLSRHNRKSLFLTKVYSNIHFFLNPAESVLYNRRHHISTKRKKEGSKETGS